MLFDKLLSKEPVQENEPVISYQSVNYFKVINPSEIQELAEPPFGEAQWSEEEAYKTYLERVQPLFDEYERTGSIHTLKYSSFEDVEKNREEQRELNNFNNAFLNFTSYINVGKNHDGTYKVISNGRHRMYVAKKYGLRLLVHVSQEEYINASLEQSAVPDPSRKRKGR